MDSFSPQRNIFDRNEEIALNNANRILKKKNVSMRCQQHFTNNHPHRAEKFKNPMIDQAQDLPKIGSVGLQKDGMRESLRQFQDSVESHLNVDFDKILNMRQIFSSVFSNIMIFRNFQVPPNFSNFQFFSNIVLFGDFRVPRIFQMSRFFQKSCFSGISGYPRMFKNRDLGWPEEGQVQNLIEQRGHEIEDADSIFHRRSIARKHKLTWEWRSIFSRNI